MEAVRVERNLGNQCIIGHHHCNSTEEYLQVIGQLRTPRITWVHCYGDKAVWIQRQLCSFEVKRFHISLDGALNAKHLLSNNRQHFQLDTVELVKAGPGTG